MSRHRLWILPALLLIAVPAHAGVADSPLPLLNGIKSKHVFSVTGAIQGTNIATSFICGSLEKDEGLWWSVEAFGSTGALAGSTDAFMSPGEVQTISLGGTSLSENVIVGPANSGAPMSARIVATSTKLTCTAQLMSRANNGEFTFLGVELPVVKKTSQKGD